MKSCQRPKRSGPFPAPLHHMRAFGRVCVLWRLFAFSVRPGSEAGPGLARLAPRSKEIGTRLNERTSCFKDCHRQRHSANACALLIARRVRCDWSAGALDSDEADEGRNAAMETPGKSKKRDTVEHSFDFRRPTRLGNRKARNGGRRLSSCLPGHTEGAHREVTSTCNILCCTTAVL